MPVRINPNAEPLSFAARTDTPPHPDGKAEPFQEPILAPSKASDTLRHEMRRYCDGLVRGRSFLIAGHRGSGKTTMIDHVVLQLQKLALKRVLRFKPLPVYLQGPLLFPEREDPAGVVARAGQADGSTETRSAPVATTVNVTVSGAAPSPPSAPPPQDSDADEEGTEQKVLLQVAQGLHQAVAREFVERFHLHARTRLKEGALDGDNLAELAARFQIELTEAPLPARLREFWHHAGSTKNGLLFDADHGRGSQQGLREMVVLAGVSHVYERISGHLEGKDNYQSTQSRNSETTIGADAKWADLVKPLTAVVAGGAVGAAGVANASPVWAIVLGVLTALGTSLLFKMSTTQTRERKRTYDHTFIPDFTIRTLHRVMPEMFDRLHAAGLAPVFIVDELDKVDNLYVRLQGLLNNLKKLFAERAFTCLVVERGFYEELHWREELERQGGTPAPPPPPPAPPSPRPAPIDELETDDADADDPPVGAATGDGR